MQTDITEEDIQRYLDKINSVEVPQKGRCIQYQGIIYRQGDYIPELVRQTLNQILDNNKLTN